MRPRLSITQAAYYLSMRERAIVELATAGKLPHRKIGKEYSFDRDELDAWWEYWDSRLPSTFSGYLDADQDLASLLVRQEAEESAQTPKIQLQSIPDGIKCIYLLRCGEYHKIGKTNRFLKRLRELQSGLPESLETVHLVVTENYSQGEAALKRLFSTKRLRNEWYRLSEYDVEWIKTLTTETVQGIPA